ncbi:GntR family transcriptional regulator [Rhodohalobacter sp. 614A]|uniref:GntR family transcriptional regulator n=1 Tax=Rhodohalobacter sp. 614A TaxID=2908649 RepID=UPI001F3E4215|nr:GntR family transcriptional regulator [Rhodohalobacter sp. 614A]
MMDFTDRQPIYKQISDYFCQQILKEKWKPDDRVPSVREIAVQMEVNPNTAMRAFQILQDEEILINKRGVGHFIAEGAYQKTLELQRSEFIENELPVFFKKMTLLGFSCTELENLYNE